MIILHVKKLFFKKKKKQPRHKPLFNAQLLGNVRINAQAENPLSSGSQKWASVPSLVTVSHLKTNSALHPNAFLLEKSYKFVIAYCKLVLHSKME